MATLLEGHASHTGVHAAGLLVCNEPITKFCTVDAKGIAHVEKGAAESLGLLKIDVLGLRTLGILEDSGVQIDWYNLPFDDKETYDVFNAQRLCGIFQFEGNALRAISGDIDFRTIVEIDAVTALARPGPFGGGVTEEYVKRKKGKEYTSIHPLVEKHMEETFGLPVYQEQTLAIVREIGKFDWKETSTIRKAMSKRMGKEFFDTYWEKFKAGAMSQGIGEYEARATWETINSMGAWQMNKAHTYSYAVISYWTAYLKAHHPLEFAAANLRNAKSEDSAIELLREMVREGVEYIPFDLELSEENWCVKNGKLYGGFMALKGIGDSGAKKYVAARNAGKLTQKDTDKISACENLFANIFPFSTKYKSVYDNPAGNGVACDKVWTISEIQSAKNIPHQTELVFMGEVVYKNSRDANEEINVKKRGGEVLKGQTQFADMRLRDDTGTLGARIGRYDWFRMKGGAPGGKEFIETVPDGAHLLVRAKFFNDIRFAFVTKWKVVP
jgi:DNA polymerase III alpha subunit